eukprot:GHVP01047932.1.p1 GENE.GHVP01047932.1~~GHVP01047932.1.p1  ORF type:complete len:240 (+),score=39.11 GHVP01047932.1:32-751(+)
MDMQHRVSHRTGGGAPATEQELALDRKDRLRRLALETIDLAKDPYLYKTPQGEIECRLCLSRHQNEAGYLAHTQGRKHQSNLARRAQRDRGQATVQPLPKKNIPLRKTAKIGKPAFRVTRMQHPETKQLACLFEIEYPEIEDPVLGAQVRFMSSWEQKVEPPDGKFQYVLFGAEPYETIGFKVPNLEVDKSQDKYFVKWDASTNTFSLQIHFKKREAKPLPALPQKPTSFSQPLSVPRW